LTLLQGISKDRHSGKAIERLRLMENEFADDPPKPPPKRATAPVISPISKSAAAVMSDEQWLGAIQKYRSEDGGRRTEHGWIGGAYELSQVLEGQTKKDPSRFARLLLDFPADVNRSYFEAVLRGIAGKEIEADLLNHVLERCHGLPERPLGRWICYVLERTEDRHLADEILVIAAWYALNDSDPGDADRIRPSESMLTEGFNSVRGSAAIAVGNLIQVHGARLDLFGEALAQMVRDPSIAVRTCVAFTLCALYMHEPRSAVQLFTDLCEAPEALLATQYVREFIRSALPSFFNDLEAILRRMMGSPDSEISSAAAYEIVLTSFRSDNALALASECARGSDSLRIGAAQLYAEAIQSPSARPRSEHALRTFFSDPHEGVREAASSCFYRLPEDQLQQYVGLIQAFVESPAFRDFHSGLIRYLHQAKGSLPDVVLAVATAFLDSVDTRAADLSTSTGHDGYLVQKLVFRMRQQASEASMRQRCDALISRMLDIGIYGVKKNLQRLDEEKGY